MFQAHEARVIAEFAEVDAFLTTLNARHDKLVKFLQSNPPITNEALSDLGIQQDAMLGAIVAIHDYLGVLAKRIRKFE